MFATFNPVDAYQQSLARWLVQTTKKGLTAPINRISALALKLFGRNLSEFLATRFAAAVSIVTIVLTSLKINNSSISPTALDVATNSLFLAASMFDLVAAVSTWVGTYAVGATGASVLSVIASFAGVMSIVATIAGFILVMVGFFDRVTTPPVCNFYYVLFIYH